MQCSRVPFRTFRKDSGNIVMGYESFYRRAPYRWFVGNHNDGLGIFFLLLSIYGDGEGGGSYFRV